MRRTGCARFVALASIAMVTRSACLAQGHPEYSRLGQLGAALYKPDSGPAPHVAFVLAHRTANYLNYIGCRELSARGANAFRERATAAPAAQKRAMHSRRQGTSRLRRARRARGEDSPRPDPSLPLCIVVRR